MIIRNSFNGVHPFITVIHFYFHLPPVSRLFLSPQIAMQGILKISPSVCFQTRGSQPCGRGTVGWRVCSAAGGLQPGPVLPQARVGLKGTSLPLWRLRWALLLSPCAAAEPRRGHPCDIPLPEGRASGRGQPLAAPCPGA